MACIEFSHGKKQGNNALRISHRTPNHSSNSPWKSQTNLRLRVVPFRPRTVLPRVLVMLSLTWLIRQREVLLVDAFPLVDVRVEVDLGGLNRRVTEVLLDYTEIL